MRRALSCGAALLVRCCLVLRGPDPSISVYVRRGIREGGDPIDGQSSDLSCKVSRYARRLARRGLRREVSDSRQGEVGQGVGESSNSVNNIQRT